MSTAISARWTFTGPTKSIRPSRVLEMPSVRVTSRRAPVHYLARHFDLGASAPRQSTPPGNPNEVQNHKYCTVETSCGSLSLGVFDASGRAFIPWPRSSSTNSPDPGPRGRSTTPNSGANFPCAGGARIDDRRKVSFKRPLLRSLARSSTRNESEIRPEQWSRHDSALTSRSHRGLAPDSAS